MADRHRNGGSSGSRAAAVSRTLHAAGIRPLPSGTPRTREGLRVKASNFGRTQVQFDYDQQHYTTADLVTAVLDALLSAGYTVEQAPVTEDTPYPSIYASKAGAS